MIHGQRIGDKKKNNNNNKQNTYKKMSVLNNS